MFEIEYATVGDEKLMLDVYRPGSGESALPVALVVHGGGWCSGDKRDDLPFMPTLVDAGFVVVSVNYRLAPKHRWPAGQEDVYAAVRWAKANIARHGGDPARLAAIGYSAGGQLALQAVVRMGDVRFVAGVGLAAPVDKVLDMLRRGGELSASMKHLHGADKPDAEIASALWEMSPINYLRPGLPPMLMIAGTADTSVPYVQAVHFVQRCRDIGIPCDLITVTGAGHGVRSWDQFDPAWMTKLANWLRSHV